MSRPDSADPSMDEILASIRRIITDETPPLPSGDGDPPPPAFTPMEPEVLELTHPLVEDEDAPTAPEERPAAPPTADLAPAVADQAIAGVVRDMLRPMLQAWLDAYLPALVERLVAEEVRRITKRD